MGTILLYIAIPLAIAIVVIFVIVFLTRKTKTKTTTGTAGTTTTTTTAPKTNAKFWNSFWTILIALVILGMIFVFVTNFFKGSNNSKKSGTTTTVTSTKTLMYDRTTPVTLSLEYECLFEKIGEPIYLEYPNQSGGLNKVFWDGLSIVTFPGRAPGLVTITSAKSRGESHVKIYKVE